MTIKTVVTVGRMATDEERAIMNKFLTEDNKDHDGTYSVENPDDPALRTVTRVWATEESAQAWIDLVNSLFTPTSAQIVIE